MNETEMKVYEAGFHITPNLSEEDIRGEYEAIRKLIQANEGTEIISEGLPTLKNLAYTISKTFKAQKSTYTRAYFAWIKFATTPEQVIDIKKELDEREHIIRSLVIGTVRENTLVGKPEGENERTDKNANQTSDEQTEESLASLDKTIDDLVVN